MQYLLTQEEMDDLNRKGASALERANETIQRLCTRVSDLSVGRIAHHAGCILNPNTGFGGYCGNCPVIDECPHGNKRWSK
jgi:hypothetical protein